MDHVILCIGIAMCCLSVLCLPLAVYLFFKVADEDTREFYKAMGWDKK